MAFSIPHLQALAEWLRPPKKVGPPASSSDETLRLLAENVSDVIFRFSADGLARYISPSVERLYGYRPAEIYAMGGDVASNRFTHPDDQAAVAAAVHAHFRGDLDEVKLEFRIIHRSGKPIWVQTNCSTVLDSNGRPTDIIFTMRDISERKALEIALEKIARSDGLTALANRRAFDETLDHEWRRAMRERTELSLLLIDVDHFKGFNDANGHQVGDDCLRTLAGTMRDTFQRAGDLTARYGGEEFAVIMPQTSQHRAVLMAQEYRRAVAALCLPNPSGLASKVVTVSIGAATAIATCGGTTDMPAGLLAAADAALYKAKAGGRDRVEAALRLTPSNDSKAA
ncbi:MAG: sensor domain-containing diguanylate cyclase [Sphingomicrobium sp.]